MAELLLLRLHGPMASWGDPAVGDHRRSATHPGRSALIGLLSAALGYRREQQAEIDALARGLGLAVRLEAGGELLRDFHTVEIPPSEALKQRRVFTRKDEVDAFKDRWRVAPRNTNPVVSKRDYRVDAAWLCALWRRPQAAAGCPSLSELAEALRRPRFVLYLGRKGCPPAWPLAPRLLEAGTLKEAFDAYERWLAEQEGGDGQAPSWAWLLERLRSGGSGSAGAPRRYFWEEPLPEGMDSGLRRGGDRLWVVPRRDEPRSRSRWLFGVREEHHGIEATGGSPCS